jgi:acyl dehydratase
MAGVAERIPVGTRFRSQRRTITDSDLSLLNNLVWATAPVHSDLEFARSTPFGDRIMDGPSALAVVIGLSVIAETRFIYQPSGTRSVALIGLNNVQFKAPVLPMDTLQVESEVLESRSTSSGERGSVRYSERASKSDGTTVLQWERVMLIEEDGQDGYVDN